MSVLSNAHTHTSYCDGMNAPLEMVEKAESLGFVSLGFSGHADQGFDPDYSMTGGRQRSYMDEINALKRAGGRTRIWLGLEQDALARDAEGTDYIIGSAHYMPEPFEGGYAAVDGSPAVLKRLLDERYLGDALALAGDYYKTLTDFVIRRRPDIIGHFDIIRKYADITRPFGDAYRGVALDALRRVSGLGCVLEINTSGMFKSEGKTPYPDDFLIAGWLRLGERVTVTSDCHDARYLDFGFDDTVSRLKRLGCKSVMRLGSGDSLWEEIEI